MTGRGSSVELIDLVKTFPRAESNAVDGVNLTIAPGEFMTFLGPSGSGKTTTLNMIAGFTSVTSGQILVKGEDIARTPTHKRNMGMVFQHYALFPHMTAAENVAFGLEQRKVPKDEISRRVKEALALVNLQAFAERKPSQMSGGQQQRVAVARALVIDPQVLLMDEPLGALDKRLREQLQVEIGRLHRSLGLTFVFVTHDQEEALSLSDRIAVFNEGGIEQVGSAEDLYERPETLFVAGFLGDSTTFVGKIDKEGVTSPDWTLRATVPSDLKAGDDAAVVVRPERLFILPEGEQPQPGLNAVSAQITDVVYFGSSRKLVLRLHNGDPCIVREPLGEESRTGVADKVLVTWAPEHGVVVSASKRELEEAAELELSMASAATAPPVV